MSESLEHIQADCLERLARGETIEQIVAHYPEVADEIRPVLQMASQLTMLSSQPYLAAKRASRQTFLEQAAAMNASQQPRPFFFMRRLIISTAAVAVMLVLIFSAAFAYSTTALPGDAFYGAKLTSEQWRLSLTQDADTILELRARYNQERIREIEALLRAGKKAEVEFEGELESMAEDHWLVAGLTILLHDQTTIEGTPQLGELIRINGRTDAGQLFADTIVVLTGRLEIQVPEELLVTPTPQATQSRRLTATRLPLFSDPTPTEIATPTPSPEATASSTPTAEPSETPLPITTPDDGNENESNENESNENESNENESNENESNENESNENESNENESNENESNENESNENESNENESNENESNENESNENESNDNESNDND